MTPFTYSPAPERVTRIAAKLFVRRVWARGANGKVPGNSEPIEIIRI